MHKVALIDPEGRHIIECRLIPHDGMIIEQAIWEAGGAVFPGDPDIVVFPENTTKLALIDDADRPSRRAVYILDAPTKRIWLVETGGIDEVSTLERVAKPWALFQGK